MEKIFLDKILLENFFKIAKISESMYVSQDFFCALYYTTIASNAGPVKNALDQLHMRCHWSFGPVNILEIMIPAVILLYEKDQ